LWIAPNNGAVEKGLDGVMAEIDPRAIVSPKAELAEDVVVGPYTIIEEGVIIGQGTQIGPHVFVASGSHIGRGCKIFFGTVIGTPPQDVKYRGEETTVEIGDHTIIREYCTVHRGTRARWKTVVGRECFLMAYVHVAHDCQVGDRVILANAVNMGGHVTIEDDVGIGGVVPIHQFVRIGQHAFIGGGYRVPKDVPPYILAMGEPLQYGGVNYIGLKRKGFTSEQLLQIRRAYRLIYRSNLNVSQALERIKAELEPTEEVRHIVTFIENSERGIIR